MTNLTTRQRAMRGTIAALAALGTAALLTAPADAASGKIRAACTDDYYRFCPAYEPDTPKMRQCMRQAGKRLSAKCIDALVDAGEVRRPKR